jgi:outer membrane usher protein
MSAGRIIALLCASTALAAPAAAEDAAPFVTQLRLPARNVVRDVIAFRIGVGIAVEPSDLASIGIAAPTSTEPLLLSSVPGLSYAEDASAAAIVITCTAACFATQRITVESRQEAGAVATGTGGYVNYEANVQWTDDDSLNASAIAEAALFGRWGLISSSWVAESDAESSRVTRLETSWTVDRPQAGVRMRFGDSATLAAGGAPVRFAGVQIGRHFGLTPSLITYPIPLLTGEAESASTVELYVEGVLRGRSDVAAGPFSIEPSALITGAGEAELVVRDILGREETITRPFFVSTALLRRGLSEWSASLGAERLDFGRESARYGQTFASARYRYGVTDALTLEAAADVSEVGSTVEGGASFVLSNLGEARVSGAHSETGGAASASWFYDARSWSLGMQVDMRDDGFAPLGSRRDDDFRRGAAANLSLNLGDYGGLAFTAASAEYADQPSARTVAVNYTPEFADGRFSFRVRHTDWEESELAAGVSLSLSLQDDASGHLSIDSDDRGVSYRASAQRGVRHDRPGWRARVSAGAVERADLSVLTRGALGDSMAQYAYAGGQNGVRLRHSGSIGWVDDLPFAGRRIDGAFALVDAGAPDVSITRERMDAGVTGGDGRLLVSNLQPYGDSVIGIAVDELPFDRAIGSPFQHVAPAEGMGVVVRFDAAQERLVESRVRFADGAAPARGAVLVRTSDSRRFPIGSEGRIVLQGAQPGDILTLDESDGCSARIVAMTDLVTLICAGPS